MGHSDAYGALPTSHALSPEVLRALRGLATAIGHYTMYADGHPRLALEAKRFRRVVEIPLNLSESLTILVHDECLEVGDAFTDTSDLLLSGLANRLHVHQLRSLTFRRGVRPEELVEFLTALSQKVGWGADPLGLAPPEELNRWPHVGMLSDGRSHRGAVDPKREGAHAGVGTAPVLATSAETTQYLRFCSEWMEPEALIDLVRTAAEDRDDEVAPWVIRLSSKLVGQRSPADRRLGSEADSAIRAIIRRLIEEWELEDRRPDDGAEEFVPDLTDAPTPRYRRESGVRVVSPARTVEMSIELDAANETARWASARLLSGGDATTLLDLLDEAPEQSQVASQLWRGVSAPHVLRYLLEAEQPDLDTVDRITRHVGLEGVESMLDVLARSTRRSAREFLLGQISGMGPKVGPHVAGLLNDGRWYVVRNMLHLLGTLSYWPEGFDVAPYLAHEDPRVRMEALNLAARWPDHREGAVCLALQDADEGVVNAGLVEASAACPPAAERILVRHLEERALPEKLRVQAIRALGTRGSADALKAIAAACTRRRWIFGLRLSSEDSIVGAGLVELARRWPDARVAKRVLRLAARSGNPTLSAAAAGEEPEDVA